MKSRQRPSCGGLTAFPSDLDSPHGLHNRRSLSGPEDSCTSHLNSRKELSITDRRSPSFDHSVDSLLSTDGTRVCYRTPTGLTIVNGTGYGGHGPFYVDSSSFGGDCTAVLHRVTLISLARARALQLCTKPGNAGDVLNEHLRLATIGRFPRSCRLECLRIRSQARRRPPCLPQSSFSEIIIMHTTSDRYVHTHDIEPVTVMGAAQAQS